MAKKYPSYLQLDKRDCGPTCLKTIAKFHGRDIPYSQLRDITGLSSQGVSFRGLYEGATSIGFRAVPVKMRLDAFLKKNRLPCILSWEGDHFVVLFELTQKKAVISDPAYGLRTLSITEFRDRWIDSKTGMGYAILLERTPEFERTSYGKEKDKGTGDFLLHYLSQNKRELGLLLLNLSVVALVQLSFPFIARAIVDYGIILGDLQLIYVLLGAQLMLFLSTMVGEYIRGWLLLYINGRITINLISDFLNRLLSLPVELIKKWNIGDVLQRVQDQRRIRNFLTNSSLNALFGTITILLFSIVLLVFSPTIFTVFLFGTVVYILWVKKDLKRMARLDVIEHGENIENQKKIIELVNGIKDIKVNGSERKRLWDWEETQSRIFSISKESLGVQQRQLLGSRTINEVKNIVITFLSATMVIQGSLSLGEMLAVQYIIGQLNVPMASLVTLLRDGQFAELSMRRLIDIYGYRIENSSAEKAGLEGDIVLDRVSFRYGIDAPYVLRDLDLRISRGSTVAIVGESGAGKSSLATLVLGFDHGYEGNIFIGNKEMRHINPREWRKKCGAVLQDGVVFDGSIVENILESETTDKVDFDRLERAIQISSLSPLLDRIPNGLKTRVGYQGSNLSGGERQRILIARALYKMPDFLVLDEATSALDSKNESGIMSKLMGASKDLTMLVIAHRLSTVRDADTILVLDRGRIVERGPHSVLVAKKGIYANLVENQLVRD